MKSYNCGRGKERKKEMEEEGGVGDESVAARCVAARAGGQKKKGYLEASSPSVA